MDPITRWIRKHELSGFFLLTFSGTWLSWIVGLVLFPEDQLLQAPFLKLGIFTPALVSILISGILNGEHTYSNQLKTVFIFVVVWLASWLHLVLYANVVSEVAISLKLILAAGISTTLPGFVIVNAFSKNAGIRNHLESIIKPTGRPMWYLFALLTIPAAMTAGAVPCSCRGHSAGLLFGLAHVRRIP